MGGLFCFTASYSHTLIPHSHSSLSPIVIGALTLIYL